MESSSDLYVRYQTILGAVQERLGIGCIQWYHDDSLDPYILKILEYLNAQLIFSGATDSSFQMLQAFSDIYSAGQDLIVSGQIETLLFQIKIDNSQSDWNQNHFILAWGNLMSGLYVTLEYNYANAFPKLPGDCHSCGSCKGLTVGDLGTWKAEKQRCGCGNN